MKFCKVWDEGGRSYREGVCWGWSTPAMKLRDLGVSSTLKVSRRALVAKSLNEGCSKSKKPESSSFAEVVKKDHGDVEKQCG
ncbi:hypothetical protein CK203_092700 [Vitis vinifera]|uniref:Uncharacterized protein n=1 Tax=Vitis vinifera TaxID=29760 RepID=A0A438ENT1_VITVI|nr:hypothetical protein CK203_092700 [Vitis vinifera]